jgi:predicted DNA-binding WGR domain protein
MNYCWIGWCKEDNHDKVWAVIDSGNYNYTTVWGRRGKKLQTKPFSGGSYELGRLIGKKQDKGYRAVDKSNLDVIYPDFEKDLEQTAIWAVLCS